MNGGIEIFLLLLLATAPEHEGIIIELFEKHHMDFYKTAYKILSNAILSEDAVQESYFKIVKNIEKISCLKCPERVAYCVILVKNTALDILRKTKREVGIDDLSYFPDNSDSIEDTIEKYDLGILRELFSKLKEIDQHILQMKWVDGITYKEISVLLNITEDNCNKRSQRALAKLRKEISKEGGNYEQQ